MASPEQHESAPHYWHLIESAVDQGDLRLDSSAAAECNKSCAVYLEKLRGYQRSAMSLADVQGLGSFPSGIELAERFSKKAAGGANNLVDVLQSHIDVVTQMQVVFQKLMAATTDVDQGNSASIASQLPN